MGKDADPEPDYMRGGVKTLPERQDVEGGPRKLAMEKISLMDDGGKFRPAF